MGRKNNRVQSVQAAGSALSRRHERKQSLDEMDTLVSGEQLEQRSASDSGRIVGVDEESQRLRTGSEFGEIPDVGWDDPAEDRMPDSDRPVHKGTDPALRKRNPRLRDQGQLLSDMTAASHGWMVRSETSVFQRILRCEWSECGQPIQACIDPEDWPCECGSSSGSLDRVWCKCAGCLGYRQSMESGYAGNGAPKKYCSDRCCKNAKNARKKVVRGQEKAQRLGLVFEAPVEPETVAEFAPVMIHGCDDVYGKRGVQIPGDHPLAPLFGTVRVKQRIQSGLEGTDIRC